MVDKTLALCCDLISRRSVTPEDQGCQALMISRLEAIGFECTPLPFGKVQNFWAIHGDSGPLFVFAGHTDVVPPVPKHNGAHHRLSLALLAKHFMAEALRT